MNAIRFGFYMTCILISAYSCSDQKPKATSRQTPVIKINTSKMEEPDLNFFCSKIELTPLETSERSLVSNKRNMVVTDKYYIINDNHDVVSIFDKKGGFISNSKNKIGFGPGEYQTFIGFSYNFILNSVDILTPNGKMIYDMNFNFIGKVKLPMWRQTDKDKPSQYFETSYPLNKEESIMLPTTVSTKPFRIVRYNNKKNEIIGDIDYNADVIAGINSQIVNLFPLNDSLICFSPQAFSYTHYVIDKKTFTLEKAFIFDFGKQNVDKSKLEQYQTDQEKNDYLLSISDYPLPLRTFFNNDYIISTIKIKESFFTYLNLKKTNKSYFFKNNGKTKLPFFDYLNNHILYVAVLPYELKDYIVPEMLDQTNRDILERIKDDDNPVVVKYFLN